MIRRDDHIARADYDLTPARHPGDVAPADVDQQATIDPSRPRRVAAKGRVLALYDSHNGHPLSDSANVGKLALMAVQLVSADGRLHCGHSRSRPKSPLRVGSASSPKREASVRRDVHLNGRRLAHCSPIPAEGPRSAKADLLSSRWLTRLRLNDTAGVHSGCLK